MEEDYKFVEVIDQYELLIVLLHIGLTGQIIDDLITRWIGDLYL